MCLRLIETRNGHASVRTERNPSALAIRPPKSLILLTKTRRFSLVSFLRLITLFDEGNFEFAPYIKNPLPLRWKT
jgi:hypothetical protein